MCMNFTMNESEKYLFGWFFNDKTFGFDYK